MDRKTSKQGNSHDYDGWISQRCSNELIQNDYYAYFAPTRKTVWVWPQAG